MAENKQIFPWGLHPLEPWIKEELDKRAQEYDLNPTSNIKTEKYSGPKTAWGRVFSNGISSLASGLEGFVMGGTEGFDESYGFTPSGYITIGVDAYGKPHKIDSDGYWIINPGSKPNEFRSDFPHRPPPSIVSIDSEFSGGSNSSFNALCRKTKITWKCYSLSQLEYLTPYFLSPRISVLVEWGWNHYDTISLVDLTHVDWLYGIFEGKPEYTSKWIEASRGNYDLAMGFITDYTYALNEFGGYDCTTTITNANYLIEGKSYQNRSDSKRDKNDSSKSIKLKDFTEFVFDNADNLSVKTEKSKKSNEKNSTSDNFNLSVKGKIFKYNGEKWLKMDLITEIINKFFTMKFIDSSGKEPDISIGTFDIKDVPILAHPALKSTSKNFILPNKFAPRFVTKEKKEKIGAKKLTEAKTPSGDYYKLFPNIATIIQENNFDEQYDDLVQALSSGEAIAESFPQYSDYTNGGTNSPAAGYWGYLSDIYVSLSHFKYLVGKNDTVLKLVEELLQNISESTCNTCQLRPDQDPNDSTKYRAKDVNFNSMNTKKDAADLMRISIGSINSAFIKSADFSIKLSGEMSNQMVMQSASGKELPEKYGTSNYDPKIMRFSKFARGDRMFDRGVIEEDSVIISNKSKEEKEGKHKHTRSIENSNFLVYTVRKVAQGEKEKRQYILAETDSTFLKSIVLDAKDKKAIYTNNAIMPGTEFKMEILGIGGITFLSQFTLDHVPTSYNYEQCVWQISQVSHKIENKVWITSITAQARPLTSLEET